MHLAQPGFSMAGSPMSSNQPLSSSAPAVPLIEHLRRLKHGTPTSPLLATLPTSTSAEPFQTSHNVGLKDLLLSSDEDMSTAKTANSADPDKSTQVIRPPAAMPSSPLAAMYGLTDARMFDSTGRHSRPAVILKQLLEDRSEPAASSPPAGDPFDISPKLDQGPSDLVYGNASLASIPSTSPSSLTPTSQLEPPFVQLITSAEDTTGMKQSSPAAPLTFSIAEQTSVSHLWSPPSFTSPSSSVDQLATPSSVPLSETSVAPVKTGIESLMSTASSQSLVTSTSTCSGGLQLKVASPRMSASRNVLLRVSVCLHSSVLHCRNLYLCVISKVLTINNRCITFLTPSTLAVPNRCCSKGQRHTGLTHQF